MNKKEYITPRIEVIEIENEGVMAASPPAFGGGDGWSEVIHKSNEDIPALSDGVNDIINDILA